MKLNLAIKRIFFRFHKETCIRRRVLIWLRTQTNEMTFTEWKQQVQEKFPVIKNPLATKLLKALESDMILTIVDKKKG